VVVKEEEFATPPNNNKNDPRTRRLDQYASINGPPKILCNDSYALAMLAT